MATLAIGPANYAGQAAAWAGAAERHLGISAYSFGFRARPFRVGPEPAFTFPADKIFPHPRPLTPLGRRLRTGMLARNSHVALDGFVPIRRPLGNGIDDDIEFLQSQSAAVALISHGSDLRHPDLHRDHFKHSYFDHADEAWNDAMRRLVERNQRTVTGHSNLRLFVSTPDQLVLYPHAVWLPLCVDSGLFSVDVQPVLSGRVPVVLHIPSRRTPPIKGTHFIDPIMQSLASRGIIQYVSPEAVSHGEMMRLMANADIVIDQLLVGAYGVTAVEAMALGRSVICAVSDEVRRALPEDPPLVTATPKTLEAAVHELIGEPDHYSALAARGREYARAWHDGRASAAALAPFVAE